jgi:hypothetical protein
MPLKPSRSQIAQHLAQKAYIEKHRPRLIFALDATASREWTWDKACTLQTEIFAAAAEAAKGVEVQLVYYRGTGECRASRWFTSAADLNASMVKIRCEAGCTQIVKMLSHARTEAVRGGLKGHGLHWRRL